MAFLVVVMALLNVPGQVVVETLVDEIESEIGDGNGWYVHGWPLVALRRGSFYVGPDAELSSPWNLTEDVFSVDSLAIALDALTAVLLILAGGVLFQAWRRHGGSFRRFRLSTFFVFFTLVAIAVQYIVRARAAGQSDRATVEALPADAWLSPEVEWQRWGPTWLRHLVGDGPFEGCDRAVSIYLNPADVRSALALRELKVVGVGGDISNDQLQLLSEWPKLEDLSLGLSLPEDPGIDPENTEAEECSPRLAFPPLANLRRLDLGFSNFQLEGQEDLNGGSFEDLSGPSHRLVGLENLKQLDVLHLSGAIVCDDELRAVGQLRKLRFLSIEETAVTRVGLAHLAGLTDLRELYLDSHRVDDVGVQFVAQLKQLRSVTLGRWRLTDACLASLKPVAHLESLTLHRTRITPAGLAGLSGLQDLQQLSLLGPVPGCAMEVHYLAALPALRELDLADFSLTDADVPSLARFTHLESLSLGNTRITAAGFAALRAALPNCRVVKY